MHRPNVLLESDVQKDWPRSQPRMLQLSELADIAAGLGSTAHSLSDQLPAHPRQRTALRLVATDTYDIWLLRWPPGTCVTPHDHGLSAGAFSVVVGEVEEVRWKGCIRHSRPVGPGEVVIVDRGVVHDVLGGAEPSLTVHVYSPPLSSMSYYRSTGVHGAMLVPIAVPHTVQ